ncbi:hypothetical protein M514_05385 [Trichuris suis]|uniref:Ig-like domain-containing protein n=1 Tax=Trichuris suis TaxID=68888 RepID=A0A085M8Y4_9BILA|nr:hypothetical protein M513_05385 [Trichuris suis]KFD72392.1 hypothetical protein M514_05385 [Trichuris suis]
MAAGLGFHIFYVLLVTLAKGSHEDDDIIMHTRKPGNNLKSIKNVTWQEGTSAHLYCWSKRQTTHSFTFTCENCNAEVKEAISSSNPTVRDDGPFNYIVLNKTTIDQTWHGITIVCKAKDDHDDRSIETSVKVIVTYFSAPVITQNGKRPVNGYFYTEGEAQLLCKAFGNPNIVSYQWNEGNEVLSYKNELTISVDVLGTNRTVTCIARSCSGKEKFASASIRRYALPRKVENNFNRKRREVSLTKNSNETVTLYCETKSYPQSTISWYFTDPDGKEMNANCSSIREYEEKVARLIKVSSSCILKIDGYEKSGYYSCEACLLDANIASREACFPDKRTSTEAEIVVKGPFQLTKAIDNGTHIYIEFNANPMHHALLEYWIDNVKHERNYTQQHPQSVAYNYKIMISDAANVRNLRLRVTAGNNETTLIEMRKDEESSTTIYWVATAICVLLMVVLVLFCFIAHKACFARKKKYVTSGRKATLPQTTTMYM